MSLIPPEIDSIWRHYKGGVYIVTAVALDAEKSPMTEVVIYRRKGEPDGSTWARSLSNWHSRVGPPDGTGPQRFTLVEEKRKVAPKQRLNFVVSDDHRRSGGRATMSTRDAYTAAEAYAEALFSDGLVGVRDSTTLTVEAPDGAVTKYEAEFHSFDSIALTEVK